MTPDEHIRFAKKCRKDPLWFARSVLGVTLWWLQEQILLSIRDNVRTAVKACHAPGKTFTAAVAVLWFLCAHKGAIVITTAPTWRQVKDVLWREIRRLREQSRMDLGGDIKLDPPTLEFGAKWYAMGLSPKDEDSFAGWHAPHVLVICDEASGVPIKILEALRGPRP
jgi:tRNA(Met) C34 N-acetyltransferase TmcA